MHHLIPNNNAMHTQGFLAFEDPDLSDEPGPIAQPPQAEAGDGIAAAGRRDATPGWPAIGHFSDTGRYTGRYTVRYRSAG